MTDPSLQVFVVDDDREMRNSLGQFLEKAGCVTKTYASAKEALGAVATNRPDVLVSDVRMPDMNGLDLLDRIASEHGTLPVVMITAHGDVPMAVDAMQAGATDFIEKPFQPHRLLDAIQRAAKLGHLSTENQNLKKRLNALSGLDRLLIGESPEMLRLREETLDVAPTEASVLILGETGTGKALVAHALHDLGPRAGRPFVTVNCAAIPDTDFESGILARADTGTLFLDKLDACPPEIQAKLLRVAETQPATSRNAPRKAEINVRAISTSSADLDAAMRENRLREDLYYRLNTVIFQLPSLRERGDDIALLYTHFESQYARLYETDGPDLTSEDMAALLSHDWPGNVRELRNVAERRILAARRGRGSVAEAINLDGATDELPTTLREAVAAFERQMIGQALQVHEGRMDAVAEALGIGRRTLNEKIVKLGLRKEDLL
ncbi:MAG: sigma-54-dependent Fis family transcriptional regulator [Rhodospirillaceae bacterium]|jgi:DNA-binding NtrC family response regulator|nr:sigma-54-dependent Fis family transcriptional regulator [Rhodospirillaceae bacterium]MBT6405742.1 sigma-54-dependent Fis family transcriptional regulator [Rhodospirillaceae bacterium]MBT6536097.1 sigma-54-dependent Fis family transcriptional regulator [Rhodospirillaceae bacterium]